MEAAAQHAGCRLPARPRLHERGNRVLTGMRYAAGDIMIDLRGCDSAGALKREQRRDHRPVIHRKGRRYALDQLLFDIHAAALFALAPKKALLRRNN